MAVRPAEWGDTRRLLGVHELIGQSVSGIVGGTIAHGWIRTGGISTRTLALKIRQMSFGTVFVRVSTATVAGTLAQITAIVQMTENLFSGQFNCPLVRIFTCTKGALNIAASKCASKVPQCLMFDPSLCPRITIHHLLEGSGCLLPLSMLTFTDPVECGAALIVRFHMLDKGIAKI